MKSHLAELSPQYIVDDAGKKTKIIVDLKRFEQFLEEMEDRYLSLLAQKTLDQEDEYVSHEEAKCLSESKE